MFFDQSTLIAWLHTHSFQQLSAGQYGGTFVDWSINYLCNVDKHAVVESNWYNEYAVPVDPIATTGSAHEHDKNTSGNAGEIVWQWHFLNTHYPKNLHTFYLHTPNPWNCKFTKSPLDMVQSTEYLDHYLQFVINFFSQNPDIPHIVVYPDFDTASWVWLRRYRTTFSINTFDDFGKQNILAPFTGDTTLPREDIREHLALCSVPYHLIEQKISHTQLKLKESLPNCHAVSITEIFNDLENVLRKIQARNPSLNFDNRKWKTWRTIYLQWRQKNIAELDWCKNLNSVVDKIINQVCCPTDKLSDLQELAIETELLIRGYSIKNFGLKSFPNDLSLLELEPLIHYNYVNELINAAQLTRQ
jgi:hypothetical protein